MTHRITTAKPLTEAQKEALHLLAHYVQEKHPNDDIVVHYAETGEVSAHLERDPE